MRLGLLCLFVAAFLADVGFSDERVTATGKVVDTQGKPVEHATVLVYSAGVKKGYSIYCPTCYLDCGKRAITDADGQFTIPGLSGDLWFNLLVVHEESGTKMIEKVDPAKTPPTVTVEARVPVANPAQVAHGRVVDVSGNPIRDVLIEHHGAMLPNGGAMYGDAGWIDLVAVSNEKGEFEIANQKPLRAALLQVSPRGMSSKLVTVPTGEGRMSITAFDGVTVRGRLVSQGKPLANVQVGLSSHDHNSQTYIPEVRIGTDADGRFALTNVPAGRVFDLVSKMESLAPLGLVADPVQLATKDNGQEVSVGEIAARPAFTLRGKVVLPEGEAIPPDMRILLSQTNAGDNQTAVLAEDGSFEFKGLGHGTYTITPSVRGYELDSDVLYAELLVEGNINNCRVTIRRRGPKK